MQAAKKFWHAALYKITKSDRCHLSDEENIKRFMLYCARISACRRDENDVILLFLHVGHCIFSFEYEQFFDIVFYCNLLLLFLFLFSSVTAFSCRPVFYYADLHVRMYVCCIMLRKNVNGPFIVHVMWFFCVKILCIYYAHVLISCVHVINATY